MDGCNLRICTFNCCSLRKNIDLVRLLADDNYDVIFLQETFVVEEKLGQLDFIDEKYDCIGVPAVYSEKVLVAGAGRPEGGLAVLWKKNSLFKVNGIVLENNFIIFNILLNGIQILLVNVFLNSDIWEVATLEKYLQSLSLLENIIEEMNHDSVYFIGDFNADPFSGRAWGNLNHFIDENNLICFDFYALPNDTYTFISYGNSVSRWLDHVVGKSHENVSLDSFKVLHEINGSDHVPLEFVMNVKGVPHQNSYVPEMPVTSKSFVNWTKLKMEDFQKINDEIDSYLLNMQNYSFLDCNVIGCHNKKHLQEMDEFFGELLNAVKVGSSEFETFILAKNKFKVIPGWNRRVKRLHAEARNKYLSWLNEGKPLQAASHDSMLETRRNFKHALNYCKANEHQESCQSIVEKFIGKDFKQFWIEVKKKKGCIKNTSIINGKNDNSEIAQIFAEKFLDSKNCKNVGETEFINTLKEKWHSSRKMHVKMSLPTLKKLILTLNCGMGHDGIHSLFLRNASELFLIKLILLINGWFLHCYLSTEVLKGTINPTVKDYKGNITEAANYRPVMQSSCILKLIEQHILYILSEKISVNCRQFGFQAGTSTADACFLLKEVMAKYSKCKQHGYLTFIDLSKAFDLVDHYKLGFKLIEREIPIDIIYFLMHYMRNQVANVA